MFQLHRSITIAVAVWSTVFLCSGFVGTLSAQDNPRVTEEPKLIDSRLDLIAPERLDPHRGETVLWGIEQEREAAKLQQQIAEVKELIQKTLEAGDDEQVTALKQKLMIVAQQKKQLDRIRSANERGDTHQKIQTASTTETGSEGKVRPASHGLNQIRALHEAAERLQNSGLKEVAHELRQRAEMMEKEMIVHREHMERAHKQQLERDRIESDSGSQELELRLNELSEQVESLQRSVKELNEKMNHILELLKKQQGLAK